MISPWVFPVTNMVLDPHSSGVFLVFEDSLEVDADSCSNKVKGILFVSRYSMIVLKTAGDYSSSTSYYFIVYFYIFLLSE